MATNPKWETNQENIRAKKTVTFQDLVPEIRTRFVSQDEKNKTKPRWEIIHRGNTVMGFPDMRPQTWLEGALLYFFEVLEVGTTPKDNKIGK